MMDLDHLNDVETTIRVSGIAQGTLENVRRVIPKRNRFRMQ